MERVILDKFEVPFGKYVNTNQSNAINCTILANIVQRKLPFCNFQI